MREAAEGLAALQLAVHPGDGLVANFGRAVVVARASGVVQEGVVEEILTILQAEMDEQGKAPGRRMVRRLAGLLAEAEPEDVPAFCAVGDAESGTAVILHGSLELEVQAGGETSRLSGRAVATWVDRLFEMPIENFVVVPSGAGAPPVDPIVDLRSGVVRGNGVTARPRLPSGPDPANIRAASAAPANVSPPAAVPPAKLDVVAPPEDLTVLRGAPSQSPERPMVDPQGSFVAVSLLEPLPEDELVLPLPVAGDELPPDAPDASGAPDEVSQVEGIVCSRGHFTDPAARFCSSCGISMVHQTHNLVSGHRPPLGVLILDDGATFVLDDDYVIGREVDEDPDVLAGKARPLVLSDPERTISRVHARVNLHGWDVKVTDANSSNGTYLAEPGDEQWTLLPSEEPRTIRAGTRILVGGRSLVFESPHRS